MRTGVWDFIAKFSAKMNLRPSDPCVKISDVIAQQRVMCDPCIVSVNSIAFPWIRRQWNRRSSLVSKVLISLEFRVFSSAFQLKRFVFAVTNKNATAAAAVANLSRTLTAKATVLCFGRTESEWKGWGWEGDGR